MEKVLISLFSALLGFFLSQSLNVVRFIRRPKFRTSHFDHGVLQSYSGDPPETPSEVRLGFYLENFGYNSAKNTRIFVSRLMTAKDSKSILEESLLPFSELSRPINVIPPGESIIVTLGTIRSDHQHLEICYNDEILDEDITEADTRYKRVFSARFYIHCDDVNSTTILDLTFDPTKWEWTRNLLDDMEPILNPWEKLQAAQVNSID